jgi:putative pyruvate formate lyase activating enzyme
VVQKKNKLKELDHCLLCPRECGVNRNEGQTGYCGRGSGYDIASVCIHKGEEPPISGKNGICNIFFSGCNLQCLYCQNFQISRRNQHASVVYLEGLTRQIEAYLDGGIETVGFVSPTHFTPHVKSIIHKLHNDGYSPIIVYNTNCFDNFQIIKSLEGLIDVYLPDFKYFDPVLANQYSDASSYPEVAKRVILEMYRQKGSTVVLNENGQAVTGLIIRHLVLPGQTKDSIRILEWIASELSPAVYISLMSQYFPTVNVADHPALNRKLTVSEYHEVTDALERLGFYQGWIQDYDSSELYNPDFTKEKPFEV